MRKILSIAMVMVIAAGAQPFGDEGKKAGAKNGDPMKDDTKRLVHPINLEKLNTEADEDDPFSADGLNLYYASNKSGRWEIMHAKHAQSSSPWPKGESFQSAKDADFRSP